MTTLDVDLAKRAEVRLVFGYLGELTPGDPAPPLSIGNAIAHLHGIEDLLFLAAVEDWNGPPDATGVYSPAGFVQNVHVKRLSYASPLEVVVWFFAGTSMATLTANRLINVWNNFQAARRNTKGTEVFLAAANVLQATIDAPIPIGKDTPGFERFSTAAEVLAILSSLEVEEEA